MSVHLSPCLSFSCSCIRLSVYLLSCLSIGLSVCVCVPVSLSVLAHVPPCVCWPVSWCVYSSVLTMEVEAVTYALHWIALRGDSQTTHAIILTDSMCLLQKVKSGMGSPDWNVSMVDIHLQKLLWVYCPGHTGVKGND